MSLKKHIPNTITSMNLLLGAVGVVFSLEGRLDQAFYLMLGGIFLDFFDGLTARILGVQGAFGKELDSLADLVTSGMLPAAMLHMTMKAVGTGCVISLTPLLIVLFSGLRLAKFNLDERQHSSFIGLPTPAAALICGSLAYDAAMKEGTLLSALCSYAWFIPLLTAIICALLVSEIPMFSLKFGKKAGTDLVTSMKRTALLTVSAICVLIVVMLGLNWSMVIFLSLVVYVLLNLTYLFLERKP